MQAIQIRSFAALLPCDSKPSRTISTLESFVSWVEEGFNKAEQWGRRYRERRELRSLSARDVSDFCPKHTDAEHEAHKPFWRA